MNLIAHAPVRRFAPVVRKPEPPQESRAFYVVTGFLGITMFVLFALALASAAAVVRTTL